LLSRGTVAVPQDEKRLLGTTWHIFCIYFVDVVDEDRGDADVVYMVNGGGVVVGGEYVEVVVVLDGEVPHPALGDRGCAASHDGDVAAADGQQVLAPGQPGGLDPPLGRGCVDWTNRTFISL
jgi:hypothetical protein